MTTLTRRSSRWTPLGVAAAVLGFAVWWPIGLAVLTILLVVGAGYGAGLPRRSTGNAAFDAYRAETLERLEREQADFDAFVTRLREARDRDEFEKFMTERRDTLKSDVTRD